MCAVSDREDNSIYEELKGKIPCVLINKTEDILKKIIEHTQKIYA
ncbi:MAG: hypothetical protein ABDH37_06715 [Candidatus Hydrothermales bacterium]